MDIMHKGAKLGKKLIKVKGSLNQTERNDSPIKFPSLKNSYLQHPGENYGVKKRKFMNVSGPRKNP